MTETSNEIIDIEQFSKNDKKVPPAKRYRIRIDKERFVVEDSEMSGRDLLKLADKNPPERFALYQKLCGGKTNKIDLDEMADFRTPGVERFMTLPLDQTEGGLPAELDPELRRHFELPGEDIEFLDAINLSWETVSEGKTQCVIIYGYKNIPNSYNQENVEVYFNPPLSRKDGKTIGATIPQTFDGKSWQRWSRHRTSENPWRIGVDNLETHITLVGEWLVQELQKA